MTLDSPSALLVEQGQIPSSLPSRLEAVEQSLRPVTQGDGKCSPVTLFLTVDVEDAYFRQPILMSGEGVGREFGVFGILDALDVRALKGTFFVNVYEKDRQPPNVVEGVVREIAERGHEVGLHTHPSEELDFYKRPLFYLSRTAQEALLNWGADLIERWTDERPMSFRAGGYALNDDTLAALTATGFSIDSSCFFPSPNNRHTKRSVNLVSKFNEMLEVPVTTVLREAADGGVSHRKLDINWLSVDELAMALAALSRHGAQYAAFMMHSFSFIDKRTCTSDEPPSQEARFVSDVHFSRYVEVRGPKPELREAFETFLDQLIYNQYIHVRTLREEFCSSRMTKKRADDIVPIVRPR